MSTIREAYWNALLADATYALAENRNDVSGQALKDLFASRMTESVAAYVAENFSLATAIERGDAMRSGRALLIHYARSPSIAGRQAAAHASPGRTAGGMDAGRSRIEVKSPAFHEGGAI